MPPPTKKMTANPVRPARHRAGKGESSSSSDSEASDEEAAAVPAPKPKPKPVGAGRVISTGAGQVISTGSLAGVDLSRRRAQADRDEAARKARVALEKKAAEEGFVTESEGGASGDEEGSSGSEEEEDDDEEEESSSEEEAPRRLMMRPKFMSRAQRGGDAKSGGGGGKGENEEAAKEKAEAEERKKAMDAMVEEEIRKSIEARAVGRKAWESDADEEAGDVDTEDDVDPEAEYAAWKLRELKRIKRHREQIEAKEKELAEVERRRNLTEEERRAEDEAHLARQKEERDGRGKMEYLQKYYHKGAFFQEDMEKAGLTNRDIMGGHFVDEIRNRELLPKSLQMRDMTKLGRKGASKYKDLKTEDTGQWGQFADTRPGKGGFDRFGDERFRPDYDRGEDSGRGANSIPLGERRPVPLQPQQLRDRPKGREDDRPDWDRPRGGRRSRSRSRSPRRDGDGYRDRRKRSTSRERDRYDGDKRRRIDTR